MKALESVGGWGIALTMISAPSAQAQSAKPIGPFAPFVAAGDLVFVSGQLAIAPDTGKLDESASIEVQTELAWRNVSAVLAKTGLSIADVVQITVYMTDMSEFSRMNAAYAKALGPLRPARTTVEVRALPLGGRVELAVVAHRKGSQRK